MYLCQALPYDLFDPWVKRAHVLWCVWTDTTIARVVAIGLMVRAAATVASTDTHTCGSQDANNVNEQQTQAQAQAVDPAHHAVRTL